MVLHLAIYHDAFSSASDRVVYSPVAAGGGGGGGGGAAAAALCSPDRRPVAMTRC